MCRPDSCWSTVWPPTHLETGQDVITWPASSSPCGHTWPPPSQTTQRKGGSRRRPKGQSQRRTETTAKRPEVTNGKEKPSQRKQLVPGHPRYARDSFCSQLNPSYLTNVSSPRDRNHKYVRSENSRTKIISIVCFCFRWILTVTHVLTHFLSFVCALWEEAGHILNFRNTAEASSLLSDEQNTSFSVCL